MCRNVCWYTVEVTSTDVCQLLHSYQCGDYNSEEKQGE
jgi:hypothetical protein